MERTRQNNWMTLRQKCQKRIRASSIITIVILLITLYDFGWRLGRLARRLTDTYGNTNIIKYYSIVWHVFSKSSYSRWKLIKCQLQFLHEKEWYSTQHYESVISYIYELPNGGCFININHMFIIIMKMEHAWYSKNEFKNSNKIVLACHSLFAKM